MKTLTSILKGLATATLLLSLPVAQAATPLQYASKTLRVSSDPFSIPPADTQEGSVTSTDTKYHVTDIELGGSNSQTHAFPTPSNLYALAITGEVGFFNAQSAARVILIDDTTGMEYQVYEGYPAVGAIGNFPLSESCEESCILPGVSQFSLRVEVTDAYVRIDSLAYADTPRAGSPTSVKDSQNAATVTALNAADLGWIATETSVAQMTYEEKKSLFLEPKVPDLHGFDYYSGGVFELPSVQQSELAAVASSSLVESFDWRQRHGRNWVTEVKNQSSCGSCWAFAATGTVEAVANTYFNRQLNLDLAEQELLSCSGAGSCNGGNTGVALDYVARTGLRNESCFAYSATDQSCSRRCNSPSQTLFIEGTYSYPSRTYPDSEASLKKMIIKHGPIASGIISLWHAMVLVGYSVDPNDGRTVWIFKNSWGKNWGGRLSSNWGSFWQTGEGNQGYAYIKVALNNIYHGRITEAILDPLSKNPGVSILCEDRDNDQYCNWGTSANKPSSCPSSCKAERDCNDADAKLGPYDGNYRCTTIDEPVKVTKQVTVWNKGTADLSVTNIRPKTSAAWISVTPTAFSLRPNTSKQVSFTVDYGLIPSGKSTTQYEVLSNDSANNAALVNIHTGYNAASDADGDGYTDEAELTAQTDPHDAGSYPGSTQDQDQDGIPDIDDPQPTSPATGECVEVAGDVAIANVTYVGSHTCVAQGRIITGANVQIGTDSAKADVEFTAGEGVKMLPGLLSKPGSGFRVRTEAQ